MSYFIGHWQLLGYGMFAVEERFSGSLVGRVGALQPEGWPGYELAWALAPGARGRGYATEAARAALAWSFETIAIDRILSVIHPENRASQRVAERVGEHRTARQFSPFGEPCDVWQVTRADWLRSS
jgi:RimJ/RimL family protein N-acetyltransferase